MIKSHEWSYIKKAGRRKGTSFGKTFYHIYPDGKIQRECAMEWDPGVLLSRPDKTPRMGEHTWTDS